MPTGPRRSARPPLERPQLEELALGYAARFATSAARLETYLQRKLRERGWGGADEPPVRAVVARLVDAGYVDDAAFARVKVGGLLRRGYGARRIDQALSAAGIDAALRKEAQGRPPEHRAAAVAMARKRKFGPFQAERPDRATRERQIAALLRAGHPLDSARRIVDADSEAALEEWVLAAEE
jgi:regulatory protein